MTIERNRSAAPSQPTSEPIQVDTENVVRQFKPDPQSMRNALGLHTVPANHPEIEFITSKILEMGGMEGPSAFTNLLLKTIRDAEHSPFHSGDKMKDVFTFLKMRETSGSVLNGWE